MCEVTFFLALVVPGAPTRIDPTELCKALSCVSLHAHQEEMLNGDCCFHHAPLIHVFLGGFLKALCVLLKKT